MRPTIQHELMTARVADRHRHTGRASWLTRPAVPANCPGNLAPIR
jgi:hypothetical protein